MLALNLLAAPCCQHGTSIPAIATSPERLFESLSSPPAATSPQRDPAADLSCPCSPSQLHPHAAACALGGHGVHCKDSKGSVGLDLLWGQVLYKQHEAW